MNTAVLLLSFCAGWITYHVLRYLDAREKEPESQADISKRVFETSPQYGFDQIITHKMCKGVSRTRNLKIRKR